MKTERNFFNELGQTPELPPHLYGSVRKRIGRRAAISRALLAMAATLVLAAGATSYRIVSSGSGDLVSSEVADELQTVREYCNGDDLSGELEAYALYENDNTTGR